MWGDDGNAQVLEGHEGPVQCLLVLPDGSLVSGSNDKTVKIWQGTRCVKTLTGHSDTVRCFRRLIEHNLQHCFLSNSSMSCNASAASILPCCGDKPVSS